ncbi:hypothetical protein MUP65_00275 [Patescibacteria group bacterium]|nr:hypothetical protein [Patescibacteria group bacterium]
MRKSIKTGLGFGLTSGVMTTLGLMVGLVAGTGSRLAVIGGVLTIAVADALSDSLGIHVAQEFRAQEESNKEAWLAALSTFVAKLVFASSFVLPVLVFDLQLAVMVSIFWGAFLLGIFSYLMTDDKKKAWRVMGEHLFVAAVVVVTTYLLGSWIAVRFGN